MKVNKTILVAALVALCTIFTACGDPNKTPAENPKIISYQAYDKNRNEIKFEMYDTNVDPTELYAIEFKLDKEMNTNYGGWIYYGDIEDSVIRSGWVNSKTYILCFNLAYSEKIKIVFNDMSYYQNHRDYELWRDEDGNFMKEFKVEFSTKPSPRTESKDFTVNTNELFIRDLPVKLAFNEYGDNDNDIAGEITGNMQAGLALRNLFFPEQLKTGDSVTFNYKIKSAQELPKIIVNLIDTSEAADYWGQLSSVTDYNITQNKTYHSDDDMFYYEGEITFPITAANIYNCTLQFTCKDPAYLSTTKTIDFFICAGSN